MKIIVIPDSFKGTLTSLEVCETIEQSLKNHRVISVPVADGGEGTLDAFFHSKAGSLFSQSQLVSAPALNALGQTVEAPYLMWGKTAVIEMAKVAGYALPTFRDAGYDASGSLVMRATTYGVGMLINHAISQGARKIIVGLGGSCTNDGGCGMAAALGTKFINSGGESFIPTGGTLSEIVHIDNTETLRLIARDSSIFNPQIDIVGMCDVTNPLCGPGGAANVFAPQKGASLEEVELLDRGLEHLISVIGDGAVMGTVSGRSLHSVGGYSPGRNSVAKLAALPGSGAAGGMGFGIRTLLAGRLEGGINMLLDEIDFDDMLQDADLIITGEGSFDSQSLGGKVVSGICHRAKASGVPVMLVAGIINAHDVGISQALTQLGIVKCFETGPLDFTQTPEEIKKAAFANLQRAANQLAASL